MQQDDEQCDQYRTDAGGGKVEPVPLVDIGSHVAILLAPCKQDAAYNRCPNRCGKVVRVSRSIVGQLINRHTHEEREQPCQNVIFLVFHNQLNEMMLPKASLQVGVCVSVQITILFSSVNHTF